MKLLTTLVSAVALAALVAACGDSGGDGGGNNNGNGDGGANGDGVDSGFGGVGTTECSDGIDNDGDGLIDGFDPECTGAADNDEGSFATGIPGDNKDAKKQDCFFDGNSGGGDDGCAYHTCCLLEECPADLQVQFDPNECGVALTQQCIEFCAPLTPPGCDCFGCCTICNDDGVCRDILINPAVASDCDSDTLLDEEKCPACTPNDECGGNDCTPGVEDCQVCPGEPLPPGCDGFVCDGGDSCASDEDCSDTAFCSNGCCISIIE